jgi:hypothetical protein
VLSETTRDELGEALGIPWQALGRLLDFGTAGRSRPFSADGQHVVFAFSCYVESAPPAQGPEYRLHPSEGRWNSDARLSFPRLSFVLGAVTFDDRRMQ